MLLAVFTFILYVRRWCIRIFFNIDSFGSKGGETFDDKAPIFIDIKPGTAFRAGLISYIKQCPAIAQDAAFGALALYHIYPIINP
jgi:hypothetical protein